MQIQTQERSDVHDLRQQVYLGRAIAALRRCRLPPCRNGPLLAVWCPQLLQAEAVSAEYRERKGALSSKLRR